MNEQEKPETGPRGFHLFIVDGEEEINVAKYPQLAGSAGEGRPTVLPKNIPSRLLIIDGPEETPS